MRINLLSAFGCLALLLAGCATTPDGRRQVLLVGDDQLNAMGVAAFNEMKANDKTSVVPAKSVYTQCIVNALVTELEPQWRDLPWESQAFAIAEPNAFALPGGKVGINTGLLRVATDQDQLAAVLGHEIGHVVYRHAGERISQQQLASVGMGLIEAYAGRHASPQQTQMMMAALGVGAQVGVLLPYSRKHESEADQVGQRLMARAGFDPAAAVTLWQNMQTATADKNRPPKLLSTHPDSQQRIRDLQAALPQMTPIYRQARAAGKRPSCD